MRKKQILCISICLLAILANATQTFGAVTVESKSDRKLVYITEEDDYDKLLNEMGTPQSVIDNMDDNLKKYICENREQDETFEGYDKDAMVQTFVPNGIMPYVSSLPSSDMTVSIYASQVILSGTKYVKIYPSFKWKKSCSLSNDTFAFSLYSKWECKTGSDVALTLNAINSNGSVQHRTSLNPTDSTEFGYGFHVPSDYASQLPNGGYYEGYAYFYAKKKKGATNGISVKYVHDSSAKRNVSYGLSIGPASISISNNSDQLQVYSQNLGFSYSTK